MKIDLDKYTDVICPMGLNDPDNNVFCKGPRCAAFILRNSSMTARLKWLWTADLTQ